MRKMIRLRLVLLFCMSLALGLSCTCMQTNNEDEFCDLEYSDIPVVAIKMLRWIGKSRRNKKSYDVTMLAKVVKIYRQGTKVEAQIGQKLRLITFKDSATCGRAHDFKKRKEYIMKFPREYEMSKKGKPKIYVNSCQYIFDLQFIMNQR